MFKDMGSFATGVISALAFMLLIVAIASITKPDIEDIKKCRDATGWTTERCEWELTR